MSAIVVTTAAQTHAFRWRMPRNIFALWVPAEAMEILVEAVGGERVRHHNELSLVESQLHLVGDVTVVAGIPAEEREQRCDEIMTLRQRFPHIPMVAIFSPAAHSNRDVLRLGAAGVSPIVSAAPTIRRPELTVALSRSYAEGIALRLWRQCELTVPEPIIPILKAAIRLAHSPISANLLGNSTGMHERSLRKYCAANGLPSPQWIVGWARLLVAGFYLDEPGYTVEQVARILEFPSSSALRNQLKRYCSLTTRSLRAKGMTWTIARCFEDAIDSHRMKTVQREVSVEQIDT